MDCSYINRNDGVNVIFVKRTKPDADAAYIMRLMDPNRMPLISSIADSARLRLARIAKRLNGGVMP